MQTRFGDHGESKDSMAFLLPKTMASKPLVYKMKEYDMLSQKRLFTIFMLLIGLLVVVTCTQDQPTVQPEPIFGKSVSEIVSIMTVDEKLGQMTQVDRRYLDSEDDIRDLHLGSILSGGGSTPPSNNPAAWADMVDRYQQLAAETRLGIPLLYGIDAVHGHNNVVGATVFPHNIGLGATGNPELAEQLGALTGREVRATGINWTFAPCVTNSRDERWGRAYESFGEDPGHIGLMGAAMVRGFQGSDLSNSESILACTKHFIGDGAPKWGTGEDDMIDRGDAQIDEAELRALHLPPYLDAMAAGTGTIMASYNSWNGTKCHGYKYLLTDMLKDELGFDGFVVSDWKGIDEIPGDYKSDIINGVNAGIDMIMVPGDTSKGGDTYKTFVKLFREAVDEGAIPMTRIDDAVTRILTIKKRMGLLDAPYKNDRALLNTVGSDAHRDLARQAVRESMVLLKNEGSLLPLKKDAKRIVVAGSGADNVGMQCGGWTISWQGGEGDITPGSTVLDGVKRLVSESTEVSYAKNGSFKGKADAVIVVVGEEPYAEMVGDRSNLSLSKEDLKTLEVVSKSGMPYVVVLLSGRPMIISDELSKANAFVAAWLPGTEGDGIAEVLLGDYGFTGKLPVTWPADMTQIPINDGDGQDPLFPLGYGLTY